MRKLKAIQFKTLVLSLGQSEQHVSLVRHTLGVVTWVRHSIPQVPSVCCDV